LRGDAGYAEAVTETTDSPEGQPDSDPAEPKVATSPPPIAEPATSEPDGADEPRDTKRAALRETAVLAVIALVLYYVMLTFVARPYLIPSESMEPTLHGQNGVGDRIMVDKLTFRFSTPHPGDVIVFKGPPSWDLAYKSIRSHDAAIRWLQNAFSFIGFVPPDENDLVKRVIAVGGQTVQCRYNTGLTVDGKLLKEPYLDPATMGTTNYDPSPCLGHEFGPVSVPQGRLWMMGDNRTHSADSRAHCDSTPADAMNGVLCTGDPASGTVPVSNVIGKARFIVWPPGRWGCVRAVNPQQNH
jgi:signal peptidase I